MSLKIYWERMSPKQSIAAKDALNKIFNSIDKPDIIGRFEITSLSLGSTPPLFEIISITDPILETNATTSSSSSNNNTTTTSNNDGIEARVRFLAQSADAHFILEAELLVNTPTPKFIIFPISIKVSSPNISGIASVIYNEDSVQFCFIPEDGNDTGPLKDIKVEAMLGDTEQFVLMDLEKLISFVKDELREIIQQRLVYPNRVTLNINQQQ